MKMHSNKHMKPALWGSAAYIAATLPLGNHVLSLCVTVVLIILNFFISLNHLLARGKITSDIILLNLLQLSLFCCLHIQIHDVLGPAHYSYASPPQWYDWIELVTIHALRAIDLPDVIEAYGIQLQNVRNESLIAGIALFSMHIIVDIFILGTILNVASHRAAARVSGLIIRLIEEFIEFLTLPKGIRVWVLLAATYLMAMIGLIEDSFQGLGTSSNWFLFPLDNILRTLDFGDAFQIFGWRLHSVEMGTASATLAIYYRLLIASYTIMAANRLYLHLLKGHGKTVDDLAMICVSPEYSQEERMIAVKALSKFGPCPVPVISQLAKSLTNRGTHHRAGLILMEIGQEAIPHIIKCLAHKDKNIRGNITALLEKMDPWWHQSQGARSAISHFVKALADHHPDVRFAAFEVLGEINPQWPRTREACSAVTHLINALTAQNAEVRIAAAYALETIGSGASKAVFRLVRLMADSNGTVRLAVADALDRIDPKWHQSESAHNAIPYLVKLLADRKPEVRHAAIRVLGRIDSRWPQTEGARSAVPHLRNVVADGKAAVRCAAREVLDRICSEGRDIEGQTHRDLK